MEQLKKKHEVVMLPTDNKDSVKIAKSIHYNDSLLSLFNKGDDKYNQWVGQHLYVISDEEIKKGDWCVYIGNKRVLERAVGDNHYGDLWKKVIASTDSSLGLSGLSTSFISKYVEMYSAGTPITHIMVEYDLFTTDRKIEEAEEELYYNEERLKLHSDNTIITSKVKDTFTEEDMILCWNAAQEAIVGTDDFPMGGNTFKYPKTFHEWLDKNY